MAKQTINLGTVAGDGTGDPLRTALDKCNDNFDELYTATAAAATAAALSAHIEDDENPHAVTKAQVGLGNVTDHAQVKASDVDTDSTMAADSDTKVPSQKAVKAALAGKAASSHTHTLSDLSQSGATSGQVPTWNGSAWAAATPSGGSAPDWGDIGGTLAAQTDLQAALDALLPKAGGTLTGALAITAGSLTTSPLAVSQTWNNAGVTCRGLELAVTDTNSAAGSTLLRLLGGAAGTSQLFTVDKNGWINGPTGASMVIAPVSGQNLALYATGGGNVVFYSQLTLAEAGHLIFGTSSGAKIGTAANQKIAFWDATPVVQQVLPTGSSTDAVIALLQTLGLCRQS